MTAPTPQSAAALLAEAAAADARVRREAGPAASGFLATLGCASAGFSLAQPVADGDRGVLAAAMVFVFAVLGAVLALLAGRRSTRHGFARRFGLAMGAWAAVFAVGLAVGLASDAARGWAFWAPLAVLVAAPCLVGAWRELPR
ncbi:hypothetical protein [Geodermatophilus sabuli]|uniref:Uncharacterized protein n=1 Tax=Geodermatophilus sabuli TaxID=1564158 RepID=A0A285EDC2_9ACTN|nr:hypothetical protein [Geodermatophilus sabuli]MBB3083437.1 hydrogenase-4 membrane subunit HyfE [Geodermatophilus sabuli]SNX96843.1 hypothetical protein SAMN06893097_105182 [Geodermatophilus sabuli]